MEGVKGLKCLKSIKFNFVIGRSKKVFFRHIPQFVIGGSNKGFFSSYTYFKTSKKASCFTNFTHFLTEIFSSKLFLVLLWFIGYFVLKLTKFKTNLFMIKNTSPNCLNLWKFLTLNWMWKGNIFKKREHYYYVFSSCCILLYLFKVTILPFSILFLITLIPVKIKNFWNQNFVFICTLYC